MAENLRAPKGTFDLLPPQGDVFLRVRELMGQYAQRAGYGYIETPTFEDTSLFVRGVGVHRCCGQGDVFLHQQG